MKDEEMAEEYAQNLEKELMKEYEEYPEYGQTPYLATIPTPHAKQAFLAGLKAGRPQWHKVADGDLPKHNHEVLCLMWGGTKEIGYYENEVWHFEDFVADYEDVDYWQEIVPPKEIE